MTIIRTGYPMYCAHFPGGDPRRFEPDPEGATPAELAAWEAACRAADEPEGEAASLPVPVARAVGPGWAAHLHLEMFGPGVFYYPEDFMDEMDREEIGGEAYVDGAPGAEPPAPTAKAPTAVEWCAVNGAGVGDEIELYVIWPREWARVRITAIGEEAIMVRFQDCKEWAFEGPGMNGTYGVRLPLASALPPVEPAGPTARAEARADRHERLGGGRGGPAGRVEGVDR